MSQKYQHFIYARAVAAAPPVKLLASPDSLYAIGEAMICHHCRNELKIEGYISRSDECVHCGSDIHCCLNCNNYDPHAHNKCREPQAEWVTDREKGNFCDFFIPNRLSSGASRAPAPDPRAAFDNLFKK